LQHRLVVRRQFLRQTPRLEDSTQNTEHTFSL
jgi:hypothetical protein